jgi:hypothetical protein
MQRNIVNEFKALSASTESLADLMVTLPEMVWQFASENGDMDEQFGAF